MRHIGKTAAYIACTAFLTGVGANAGADDRLLIEIPKESQDRLLTEMRTLIDNLDDMLSALADGDFAEVGRIADFRMSAGHARWQQMLAEGVSEDEIQALRKSFMANGGGHGGMGQGAGNGMGQGKGVGKGMGRGKGMGQGRGQGGGMGQGMGGGGIFGQGVGRLLPMEVREMGQQMHGAAEVVSQAAKNAGATPGIEDYKAVTAGIQEVTAVCRACHMTYKIR